MKKVGFEKMFDTQELAGFFNIPLYIDKYMTSDDLKEIITEKEFEEYDLLRGLPYNNRTLFLELCPDANLTFQRLKNVLKIYDI